MALAEIGSYYISLVPTAHNITGHINKVMAPAAPAAAAAGSDAGGRFSGSFGHAVSGVGHALATSLKVGVTAAAAGVAAAGAVGLKTAAQLETAQLAFTTMLGSGEKARSFLGELKTFAAKTPFDLPGLQTAAQSLISIGIDSKKVLPIMTTLGNVTSGMGTGSEGIKRATVALQQMNAAGKISAEDLNQLRDAGIPVYELLTAATGKTTAQISEMRDKGKLGREELEALMTALETGKGFERFNGLMDQQSTSLAGLWSTLKDTFGVGMASVIEPLMPLLKSGLGGAISFLSDTVVPKGTAAMAGFVASLQGAGGVFDRIGDAWFNLRAGFNGEPIIADHVIDMPFLTRAGEVLRGIFDWVKGLNFSSIGGFFESLNLTSLAPAFQSIGTSLTGLVPAFQSFGTTLADMSPDVLSTGVKLLAGALGFLADHTDWIVANMPLIVAGFIAWRVAQMGVNAVTAISVPLMVAANVARTAAAIAEYRLVAAQHAAIASGAAVNTQQNLGLLATVRGTVATVAHNTAVLAHSTAARVAAAAQWLWNAALSANPIAIVILAVTALVGAMVWFFTQTDLGRQIFSNAMDVIGAAANWLWTSVIQPVFGWIGSLLGGFFGWVGGVAVGVWTGALDVIGAAANWLWQNIIQPAFTGIGAAIAVVWDWIGAHVVPFFKQAFAWLGETVMNFWNGVIAPAFHNIGVIIGGFWEFAQGVFQLFVAILREWVFPAIAFFWTGVVEPMFGAIGAFIGWVWGNLILPIFQALVAFVIDVLGAAFTWLWNSIIKPVWDGIVGAISWAWNNGVMPIFNAITGFLFGTLGPVWNWLGTTIGDAWSGIQTSVSGAWDWVRINVFDPMFGFLTKDVPKAWEDSTKFIGDMWEKIKEIAKAPIKWVVTDVINKGIIDTFNGIADKLPGVKKLSHVKLPDGWRTGGYTGNVDPDDVAGVVHGREYVLREKATSALIRKYGMGGLDYMNQTGRLPDGRMNGSAPADAQFVGPGTNIFGGQKSYDNVLQKQIAEHRRLNVMGSAAGYDLFSAAARWNGLAHVEVGHNLAGMAPAVNVALGEQVSMPGGGQSAGWYSASKIRLGPAYADPATNMTIIVHEIGHALGLPHPHEAGGNNADSIMNYNTTWNHTRPSAADIGALQAIYPGVAKGTNGGAAVAAPAGGGGGDKKDGGFNPFQSIMDGLGDLVKKVFPDAGPYVDAATGLVKKTFDDVSNWVLEKIGGFWDWLTGGGDDKKDDNSNGNVQQWATDGLMRTGDFNGMNLTSLIRRIIQESSGDPNAVNMWDSNKSLGGTHGLMQLLNSNFERYRDTTLPKNIYDPLANVVAGIEYTRDRYNGNLRSAWDRKGGYKDGGYVKPLLYDEGGLLEGPAYIDHRKKKPDKVLTDAQWNAMYDRATDDDTGRGDINLNVHGEGQSPEMIGLYAARTIMRKRGRR